jgi:hypothetical protein
VTAELLLAARRQRLQHLDRDLFSEPAWDMLLFMVWALNSGSRVTVGEVCRSSGTFVSTARRWLAILVDQGLVEINDGEASDELKPVQLTEIGEVRMTRVLVGVKVESLLSGSSPSTS